MDNLIDVYKCLCDETRLRILHLLGLSPLCGCHLQPLLGVSQVNVSRHLGYLKRNGMVETTRHHNWTIYRLPDPPPRELELNLACLQDLAGEMPVFKADANALRALLRDRDFQELLREGGCELPAACKPKDPRKTKPKEKQR